MVEPIRSSNVRGVVAITATYVFFLLFAQFAFLEIVQAQLPVGRVRMVMAVMGMSGLMGSLATGWLLGGMRPGTLLRAGFLACGVVAIVAPRCQGTIPLGGVAAAIGAATAVVTVALASTLRALIRGRNFGLHVGVGTGLAYGICNIPALFQAQPASQSWAVAVACAFGWWAAAERDERLPAERSSATMDLGGVDLARGATFAGLVVSFLALVWLDSAAFAIIQENLALKGTTWAGGGTTWRLGLFHFAAAILAGLLLDCGYLRGLLASTLGLFVVAFAALQNGVAMALAAPVYVIGISWYSTALVVVPSLGTDRPGALPRRWRAASLFGIAGWLGSALGVGMAQDLKRIPPLFVILAAAVVVGGWVLTSKPARRFVRVHAITAALLVAAVAVFGWSDQHPDGVIQQSDPVVRGRAVYIREGCIHCHSQYIRPRTDDPLFFGPVRPMTVAEQPPLLGNRRQGPDLRNAGIRRSAAWHRLHLKSPRSLNPDSRMPGYAHLFQRSVVEEESDGDALVAYLASLGKDQEAAWFAQTTAWSPPPGVVGDAVQGAERFRAYCAPCHGATGHGDGRLAAVVRRPNINLRKGAFWAISWGAGAEPESVALARLVRFGLPGTSMPGHETWGDQAIADVVAYLEWLRDHPDPSDSHAEPTADVADLWTVGGVR